MAQDSSMIDLEEPPLGRVMRSISQWINEGRYPNGMPLPSADVISQKLDVDRKTVHRAMKSLIEQGIVSAAGPRTRVAAQSPGVLAGTIAVFTSVGDGSSPTLSEPGWGNVMTHGVTQGCAAIGKSTLIIHDSQRQDLSARLAVDKPYGVIVSDVIQDFGELQQRLAPVRAAGVPVVVYGGAPELAGYDRVVSDHAWGSYELTRWLISQGRRRIVNAWESDAADRYWVKDRRAGYERAMVEAGLAPLDAIVMPPFPEVDWSQERFDYAVRAVAGYLVPVLSGPDAADAFMALSDRTCFGIAAACRVFGKIPGQDVLVAGYDNYWTGCNEGTLEPSVPCATVDKCNREIGQSLVRLLQDRVSGKLGDEPRTQVVQPQLVVTKAGATCLCIR